MEKELEQIEKMDLSVEEWAHYDFRERAFKQAYDQHRQLLKPERIAELERDMEIFCAPESGQVVKTSIGKKWGIKLDFDYDDSLLSSYIFWKTLFPKQGNPIEPKNGLEYKLVIDGAEYRGDTMNSWYTTVNEFVRKYGDHYVLEWNGRCIPSGHSTWEEFLSKPENYRRAFPSYIQEFLEAVYTIGNFVLVPMAPGGGFNTKRSGTYRDYWDLTLRGIYHYYEGEECPALFQEKETKAWLDSFKNWDVFVEKNFMQPFVKDLGEGHYGEPRELWDGHFDRGASAMPQNEEEFEQFFVSARTCILERGKLIAGKLKENLQK